MHSEYDCTYLTAEEIDFLRRAYAEVCAAKDIQPGTQAAEDAALKIMLMYNAGVRDPAVLRGKVPPRAA